MLSLLGWIVVIGVVFLFLKSRTDSFNNKATSSALQVGTTYQRRSPELSETQRAQFIEIVNQKIEAINTANREFGNFLNYETGYFANHSWRLWENNFSELYEAIKDVPYKRLDLKPDEEQAIATFIQQMQTGDKERERYNQEFIHAELQKYEDFFDDIEGRKLDNQQRKAIIIDDDNNLVVAGAGSGKTTTIAGKVSYLLERYNVCPQDILLISFTRKACGEMKRRIKKKMNINIDVMTFHKLGKEIIAEVEGSQPNIFTENHLQDLLRTFFEELLEQPEYLYKIVQYFVEYLKPYKPQEAFQNLGAYIQYLQENKLESFKRKKGLKEGNQTLRKEIMKSAEEVAIANFLFLNNVNYQYEEPYRYLTASRRFRQYMPDFYLPEHDIYIEHFGVIDKNGNVPAWFADEGESYVEAKQRYNEGMLWKRKIHKTHETILLETYSYQKKEGTLFEHLRQQLESHNVTLTPKTPYEIWKIISEVEEEEVILFLELIQTFLALFKSNNYSIDDLVSKNLYTDDPVEQQRNNAFLEIFQPIYEKYNAVLRKRHEIDFSDMINKATAYVKAGKYHKPYAYIIVDEFQDISIGRSQLIQAIREINPPCKLFCVGDDWQSIYRFAGSDISLFTQFEEYFGYTKKSYIETTYRFGSDLIELSGDFILKNPNQLPKALNSFQATQKTPHELLYYKKSYSAGEEGGVSTDDTKTLRKALSKIAGKARKERKPSVLILGRYGFDIRPIQDDIENFTVKYNRTTGTSKITYHHYENLKIEFLTVHKSKGLEADYVIIINCHSGKYGFPCEVSDDPTLNLVLTLEDQYENGEERRLFYVAMTRAKRGLYFLVDTNYKSKFIAEIEGEVVEEEKKTGEKCPICKTGDLLERTGRYGEFYGCSNYPFCTYTKSRQQSQISDIADDDLNW